MNVRLWRDALLTLPLSNHQVESLWKDFETMSPLRKQESFYHLMVSHENLRMQVDTAECQAKQEGK